MKVLVVDDILTNRVLTTRIMEKRGHLVKAVQNGVEAIEALTCEDFDLVLMDILMPVMDGIEATRIIRDLSSSVRCHHVPILAVSALCDGDACNGRRECLKAGMNGYVNKPIRSSEFIEMVEQYGPDPKGAY